MVRILLFVVVIIAGARLLLVQNPVRAQDDPDELRFVAPLHSLTIEFVEGTTLGEAVELADRYDLKLFQYIKAPQGNWSGSFVYQSEVDGSLPDYEEYLWRNQPVVDSAIEGCWDNHSCPSFPVWRGEYEPVTGTVAQGLEHEPIVLDLVNNNNPVFFWIRETARRLYDRWHEYKYPHLHRHQG